MCGKDEVMEYGMVRSPSEGPTATAPSAMAAVFESGVEGCPCPA